MFDDILDDLVAADGIGRGEVLLVGGEAGVGKSRLADEWAERARAAGAVILRGWCLEHGGDVQPLAPVADVLRDVAFQLAREQDDALGPQIAEFERLMAVFDRDDQRQARSAASMAMLSDGVLRMLYGLSARRPVAAVVEDLHWSDASTRQLLTFLAPRVIHHRVALILTFRTDELHRRHPLRPFLAALRRSVRPEEIDLQPFTRQEMTELVGVITGSSPEPDAVNRLHDRCAGNAFFAEELLAGAALGRPSLVLRDAVLARTQGLGEDALTLLRTAAAAGLRVRTSVLAAAGGVPAIRFGPAIEGVVAAGLWIEDADTVGFRHELAREIVEDDTLAGDRPGVHAALATAMQAMTGHRSGEIARHWLLAGNRTAALRASVAAGRAAVGMGADAEALTQFEQALGLWDLVAEPARHAGCDHVELLMDAADAAGRARLFGRAFGLGRRAVRETSEDPEAESVACLRLLPWAWFSADDEDTVRLLETAGRVVEDPPGGRTALTLAWQATLALSAGQHDRTSATLARPIARRAVDLARSVGHTRAEVHAQLTLGVCDCVEGNPEGLREIRSALDRAKGEGFAMEAGRAYDNLAFYLGEFWRLDDVIALEQEAIDYCTAAGIHRVQGVMVQLRVIRALQRRGRWQDVERRVEGLRDEFGTLDIEHLTLADSWGLIRVRQGRPDQVRELVDTAFFRMGDHESTIGPTTVTAIELLAAGNNPAEVSELVDSALARILPRFAESAAAVVAAGIRALADFARRSTPGADRGDRVSFRFTADGWLDLVTSADPPRVPPWIVIAEAERSRLEDEPDEAGWRSAVEAWRDLGAPYESAYTQWRLAEAMLAGPERQSAGTRAQARTLLIDARRIADRLEAVPLRVQLDVLAARAHLSVDLVPRRPTAAPEHDRLGLTEREAEVLRLVAQGYSNGQIGQALFISRKTASVHVSNILRKLGVSSRVEAATRSVHVESDRAVEVVGQPGGSPTAHRRETRE